MFGVERSVRGQSWQLRDYDEGYVDRLIQQRGLGELIARMVASRGIIENDLDAFLNPTLKTAMPNPNLIAGMEDGAAALAQAITEKRIIGVFGDFDVDGATSTALLTRFIRAHGHDSHYYIPDRLTEGYGPNKQAFQTLKDQGCELVFLLDCGTGAHDTIDFANSIGLEVVVVDHHQAEENLPSCRALVNPKRLDDGSDLDMLAAVGVTFMLCVATNALLRAQGYQDAPLMQWLDIVALGTVCDMVPLTSLNRALVRQGLKIMQRGANRGISALAECAQVKDMSSVDTYSCGFIFGPRINAGSRVSQSDLGARLLMSDNAGEIDEIARTLEVCNAKRKDMQSAMINAAKKQIDQRSDNVPVIFVALEEGVGHTGLSGLVAGQLKEEFHKPCCVLTFVTNPKGEQEIRGSGRSIEGVHLGQCFIDAMQAGLLINGGGHAMAGGFSMAPDKAEAFEIFVQDHVANQLNGNVITQECMVDGAISIAGISANHVRALEEQIGPFGQSFDEPVFAISNARLFDVREAGSQTVLGRVQDWEGGGALKFVAFRAAGTALGKLLMNGGRAPVHLLVKPKINEWQGRVSVDLHVVDAAQSLDKVAA